MDIPTVGPTLQGGEGGGTPHNQIHGWLAEQTGITVDTDGTVRDHAEHHRAIEDHVLEHTTANQRPRGGYGYEDGHSERHEWEIQHLVQQ